MLCKDIAETLSCVGLVKSVDRFWLHYGVALKGFIAKRAMATI